jgi:hypothetical protein
LKAIKPSFNSSDPNECEECFKKLAIGFIEPDTKLYITDNYNTKKEIYGGSGPMSPECLNFIANNEVF